jgi:acyl-CoA reductase-like NAD-dependent aldehyde dehydrogenase
VVGGERLSATTLRPTVLLQPPASSKVSREEVFGPLTCIYGFTKLDQAIEVANGLPVAFQASIFTPAIGPALRAAERLDASAVMLLRFRTAYHPPPICRIFPAKPRKRRSTWD